MAKIWLKSEIWLNKCKKVIGGGAKSGKDGITDAENTAEYFMKELS